MIARYAVNTVLVGPDRLGMIVRSNQRGSYTVERQRSRRDYGRTIDTVRSCDTGSYTEYFPTRAKAVAAYFMPYADGGYPIAYYVLSDFSGDLEGDVCCAKCAQERWTEQREQYLPEVVQESEYDLLCDNCHEVIMEGYAEEETEPRYHVMVSQPGCLPDYATNDEMYTISDEERDGMTHDESQEIMQSLADDLLETLEDARIVHKSDEMILIECGNYKSQRIVERFIAE